MRALARSAAGRALRRAGFERRRRANDDPDTTRHDQRRMLIEAEGIDLVLDGGANVGQYAGEHLRTWTGYGGRIVSFEPVPLTFERLRDRAASDPLWETMPVGLSDASSSTEIRVPGDSSHLASVLPLTEQGTRDHVQGDQEAVEVVTAQLRRLDELEVVGPTDRVLLKLDVQGYEPQALAGAAGVLDQVRVIECEVPLVPLYAGQGSTLDLLGELDRLGFSPVGMASNWISANGRCYDADVLLVRI